MKAVSLYSPYAWKGRIGLIVPSTNTVNEPEFNMMKPDGMGVFGARAMLLGAASKDSYNAMEENVALAAEQLATAEVDVIAFGCTSGSFICPGDQIERTMHAATGAPAVTTAYAVLAALERFGVSKISMGTPYVDFVNEEEVNFLQAHGVETMKYHGLQLGETQEERRGIGRVPPEAVYRLGKEVNHPEAEVVFLSCTNMATITVIEELEKDLGKPVITSNQATFSRCLQMLGYTKPIEGWGSLLNAPRETATYVPSTATAAAAE